jgi:predicted MPP superfamily phosphohydrolase
MKKLLTLTAIIGAFVLGFYFYFTHIGRVRANVNEVFIRSSHIPSAFNGVRIVQISDLLIRNKASIETLENIVETVNTLNPDIVVFTGNLFLPEGLVFEDRVTYLLESLDSNLINIAVFGYHDVITTQHHERTDHVLQNAGFAVLMNTSIEIFNQSPQGINVIGAAPTLDYGSMNDLLDDRRIRNDRFNLLLMSVPTFSSISIERPINLQLSGHCLGVQDSTHVSAPCFQFYRGIYQFADVLTLNVSDGVARFHTISGLARRPSIDSFLLIHE